MNGRNNVGNVCLNSRAALFVAIVSARASRARVVNVAASAAPLVTTHRLDNPPSTATDEDEDVVIEYCSSSRASTRTTRVTPRRRRRSREARKDEAVDAGAVHADEVDDEHLVLVVVLCTTPIARVVIDAAQHARTHAHAQHDARACVCGTRPTPRTPRTLVRIRSVPARHRSTPHTTTHVRGGLHIL